MTGLFREESPFSYAFHNYIDTVYRVARHNTPSPQDAEDISQEVFAHLLSYRGHFRDEEHLKAWLFRGNLWMMPEWGFDVITIDDIFPVWLGPRVY